MKTAHKKFIPAVMLVVASGFVLAPSAYASHIQRIQADESTYPVLQSSGPAKTRAEVRAELETAYEQGQLPVIDSNYPVLPEFQSKKTREQVKQELEQSKASGESERLDTELYSG